MISAMNKIRSYPFYNMFLLLCLRLGVYDDLSQVPDMRLKPKLQQICRERCFYKLNEEKIYTCVFVSNYNWHLSHLAKSFIRGGGFNIHQCLLAKTVKFIPNQGQRSLTHIFCFVSRHCYRINLSLQYLRFSKRTKYCHVAYCFISHHVFNMCIYDICLSLDVTHLVRHVRRRINEISALYLYAYDLSTIPP